MVISYYPEEDYKRDGTNYVPNQRCPPQVTIGYVRLENALLRITKLKELKVAALEPPDSLIHEAISIAEHALKGEG
jgi:hypothetical protein